MEFCKDFDLYTGNRISILHHLNIYKYIKVEFPTETLCIYIVYYRENTGEFNFFLQIFPSIPQFVLIRWNMFANDRVYCASGITTTTSSVTNTSYLSFFFDLTISLCD